MDPVARAWGRLAEEAVRRAYTRLGYFVVPTYAIEDGGAPMLVGLLQKFVLPDFLVAQGGQPRWVEVKFKDHPVKFQKTGYSRHGIDLPKWHAYRKVEEISGISGSLAILQYRPGADANPDPHLLQQTFAHLAHTIEFEPKPFAHAQRGMAYWNVDEMDIGGPLDFDPADTPRLTRTIHAWERKARDGRAPKMSFDKQQRSLFSYGSK
jgi:hypothetical protein